MCWRIGIFVTFLACFAFCSIGPLLFLCVLFLHPDECTTDANICGMNASCTNTVGGINCTCNHGYTRSDEGTCMSKWCKMHLNCSIGITGATTRLCVRG